MKHIHTYQLFESMIKRDKDDELFRYRSVIDNAWRPIIKEAQDFFKINFDLENNDGCKDKRTVYIKRDLRKDQPVKYEFNVERWAAGGDWESPVTYFKVELTEDYGNKKPDAPKYIWDARKENFNLYKCYVLIPGPEINNLDKTKTGHTAMDAGSKVSKISEEQIDAAWTWVEQMLEDYVEERHEKLDEPGGHDSLSAERPSESN